MRLVFHQEPSGSQGHLDRAESQPFTLDSHPARFLLCEPLPPHCFDSAQGRFLQAASLPAQEPPLNSLKGQEGTSVSLDHHTQQARLRSTHVQCF